MCCIIIITDDRDISQCPHVQQGGREVWKAIVSFVRPRRVRETKERGKSSHTPESIRSSLRRLVVGKGNIAARIACSAANCTLIGL